MLHQNWSKRKLGQAGLEDIHACLWRRQYAHASPRIQSATRSPIMMLVRLMFARGMVGMIEASTIRRLLTPRSRQCASTTAILSPAGPILAVPQGWNWVVTVART